MLLVVLLNACTSQTQCLTKSVWKVMGKKKHQKLTDYTYEKYATDKTPLLDFYLQIFLFQNHLSSCPITPKTTPEDV